MTLTEFLLARIAEDEANFTAAVDAEVESLRSDGMPDVTAQEIRDYWLRPESGLWWKRVLARCEADRRIVEAYLLRVEQSEHPDGEVFGYHATGLAIALRALALPYAEHPDYRQEWKP